MKIYKPLKAFGSLWPYKGSIELPGTFLHMHNNTFQSINYQSISQIVEFMKHLDVCICLVMIIQRHRSVIIKLFIIPV